MKIRMRKLQWVKNEKVRKVASVAIEQGEEQKGGHSRNTKRERDKQSPSCYANGHLSSQKCGVGT